MYVGVLGVLMPGVDNFAHLGGFVSGFILGKLMMDRVPTDAAERRKPDGDSFGH